MRRKIKTQTQKKGIMENILIEATKNTPMVEFFTNGKLTLAGNAYPENVKYFFNPLIDWVEDLDTEEVDFDLILEYSNTGAAKKLLEMLKRLDRNKRVEKININWFYSEEEEESLEAGQILEELLRRSTFNYIKFEKSSI